MRCKRSSMIYLLIIYFLIRDNAIVHTDMSQRTLTLQILVKIVCVALHCILIWLCSRTVFLGMYISRKDHRDFNVANETLNLRKLPCGNWSGYHNCAFNIIICGAQELELYHACIRRVSTKLTRQIT